MQFEGNQPSEQQRKKANRTQTEIEIKLKP